MLDDSTDPELQPLTNVTTRDSTHIKDIPIIEKNTFWACVWMLLVHTVPSIVSYMASYLMLTMNIHFLSDTGNLQSVGGAGLGQTWINTIFIYVIACLNVGMVVISSPAFGAKNYELVGINYHRGLILNLIIIIPSYTLALLSYVFFTAIGMNKDIVYEAYNYGVYSLYYMFAMVIFNTTNMFVVTHKIYAPLLINQILILIFHWGSGKFFITYLNLGARGAALAYGASLTFGIILVFSYILFWSKETTYKQTFFWFKKESFQGLFKQLKEEFFVGAPYFLEWLSFEIFTLMSMTFSTLQLSAWVVLYHMISLIYMVPLGFGLVISQQIANSIGERDLTKTKNLIKAAIYLSIVVGLIDVGVVYLTHKPFINIYTRDNPEIYETTVALVMLYLIMMPADFLQTSIMSILKTIGREKMATVVFTLSYYAVGLPLAFLLGIHLGMESKGVIIGVTIGCYLLFALSSVMLATTDVKKQSEQIFENRTHG